jgi:hypothetical protein
MDKGKRKENPDEAQTISVAKYIKSHASFSLFDSEEFLRILNCETPKEAEQEAKSRLNNMLSFPNLDSRAKEFIGSLLSSNLECLSNDKSKIYWENKANIDSLRLNSHKQMNIYNMTVSSTLEETKKVRTTC